MGSLDTVEAHQLQGHEYSVTVRTAVMPKTGKAKFSQPSARTRPAPPTGAATVALQDARAAAQKQFAPMEALLETGPAVGVATVLSGSCDHSIHVCSLVVRCDGGGGGSGDGSNGKASSGEAESDISSGSGSSSGERSGSRLREAREAMRRSMQRPKRGRQPRDYGELIGDGEGDGDGEGGEGG